MPGQLAELATALSGRTLLVIGDVMLDQYTWGKVTRISPEAPVPVVEVERMTYQAGGAANVARNAGAIGARVRVIGLVGDDEEGRRLREVLVESGVDTGALLSDPARPTTVKSRVIAHGQQVVRIDRECREPVSPEATQRAIASLAREIDFADAVVLSDYAKGLITPELASRLIHMARSLGKPVVVDPKGRDYAKYEGATVVTPNKSEAALALNREIGDESSLCWAGRALLEKLRSRAVLITRGEEGMSLFEDGGAVVHLPTCGRTVYDVTGAGDTVVAVLALGLAAGGELVHASILANHAAGIVVGEVGAAAVTTEKLLAALGESVQDALLVGAAGSRQ